jgi:hypothetical protein
MDPLKVSAQFAAFMWCLNHPTGAAPTPGEAARFARDNWVAFLPSAHEGCGRLLMRLARIPVATTRQHRRTQTARAVPVKQR